MPPPARAQPRPLQPPSLGAHLSRELGGGDPRGLGRMTITHGEETSTNLMNEPSAGQGEFCASSAPAPQISGWVRPESSRAFNSKVQHDRPLWGGTHHQGTHWNTRLGSPPPPTDTPPLTLEGLRAAPFSPPVTCKARVRGVPRVPPLHWRQSQHHSLTASMSQQGT